ncbi:MAG: type II toxin-antitoxin system HicB family antitoxin [Candidatus Caenarcaniphilales bacterium]|nr:type II toxin-antitoxin system HicB family antitoxin [Candidatus Caenarcaniphilales bacterium]
MRQVIFHRGEDGYWIAECPSLPGCVSQGKSKQEARLNIQEAIQAYINSLKADGLPVPERNKDLI